MTSKRNGHQSNADEEKLEAERKERLRETSNAADLDDALDDSFPASDPPSLTQPRTKIGTPKRTRRAN